MKSEFTQTTSIPDSLFDSLPGTLKEFAHKAISVKRKTPGKLAESSMSDFFTTDVNVEVLHHHRRDPFYYLAEAFICFADGDVQKAVHRATIARFLAPGSSLLDRLPLYFQHPEMAPTLLLQDFLSTSQSELDDPLDHIINRLHKAEKHGGLRIHLSKPELLDEEHAEPATGHLNADHSKDEQDDYGFITPTYISIYEEQEKYAEALALIDKLLEKDPRQTDKFREIKKRIKEKTNVR